jgi:hypothetical protein
MFKPVAVKPLSDYRIWLRYQNGEEGEVDLSDLAGRGVFALWNDYSIFEKVNIAEDGAIYWNEEVEICPDAAYLKMTGKNPEEVFPTLKPSVHA